MARTRGVKRSRASPADVLPAQTAHPGAEETSDEEDFVVRRTPARRGLRQNQISRDAGTKQQVASTVEEPITPRRRLRKLLSVNESRDQPSKDEFEKRQLRQQKSILLK